MEKIDILSLDLKELESALVEMGEKKFRAKQIFQWLHVKKVPDFDKMTDISIQLRERLKEIFCINAHPSNPIAVSGGFFASPIGMKISSRSPFLSDIS